MRIRLHSGLSLGYHTRGVGPVIAMLHPVGMDARFWDAVIDEIASNFRCIAFDLRGHGDSDVPSSGFTLDDLADDVAEALDVLAVGRKCIVVGCSLGGMVAQALALRHPRGVASLVLSNTSHTLSPEGREMMRRRAETSRDGMPNVVDTTIDRWFSADFREAAPSIVAATREHLLRIDPVVHAWTWEAISGLDFAERLTDLAVPALVMTGSADASTPPQVGKALAEALPKAAYREIAGAGHAMPLEQPQAVAHLIRKFASLPGA